MIRYLWKNKIMLILVLLSFWLVPLTISVPEQSRTESIVTAIGVDKMDSGEYEVSLQYIIPHASTSPESLKISTEKGNSIGEAIGKINLNLGKISGFAHCRFVVFNDKTAQEDLTKIFDYLLRRKTNNNNIVVVNTPKSSKEILSTADNVDSDLYAYINNSGFSNEFKNYMDIQTIGDFYNAYFSPVNCLYVNIIDMQETSKEQASESSNASEQSKSQSSSSGGAGEKPELKNEGRFLILKDGKKLISLTMEQSKNLSWFLPSIKRGSFEIKNFSEGEIKNADLTFDIYDKKNNVEISFNDGSPIYTLNMELQVRISQIIADKVGQNEYELLQKDYSQKLLEALDQRVTEMLRSAESDFKTNLYDVIECYNTFYKFKNAELKIFDDSENKCDFIKKVKFNYNLKFVQFN